MIVNPKNIFKLVAVLIMTFCAAFVCALFLNSNIDLLRVKDEITDPVIMQYMQVIIDASNVTAAISGGALILTSVVMLLFYIKHYIDTHREELGILKALGYSRIKIARSFAMFGLSVFVGCGAGFAASFALMPAFYKDMRSDAALPEITLHFNPILIVYLVIIPAFVFSVLAILYAHRKLKQPALALIRGQGKPPKVRKQKNGDAKELPFLREMQKNTVRSRFSLVFLIWFSAFCFATMGQMSISMSELSSPMMAAMILIIGVVLGFVTLFIALTTVCAANAKGIAMLKVFGYSKQQCAKAVLSGYRPVAYFGFVVGTAYQFGLLKTMITLFYSGQGVVDIPEYNFDLIALILVLLLFIVIYEVIMQLYSVKINRTPLKEIMMGE